MVTLNGSWQYLPLQLGQLSPKGTMPSNWSRPKITNKNGTIESVLCVSESKSVAATSSRTSFGYMLVLQQGSVKRVNNPNVPTASTLAWLLISIRPARVVSIKFAPEARLLFLGSSARTSMPPNKVQKSILPHSFRRATGGTCIHATGRFAGIRSGSVGITQQFIDYPSSITGPLGSSMGPFDFVRIFTVRQLAGTGVGHGCHGWHIQENLVQLWSTQRQFGNDNVFLRNLVLQGSLERNQNEGQKQEIYETTGFKTIFPKLLTHLASSSLNSVSSAAMISRKRAKRLDSLRRDMSTKSSDALGRMDWTFLVRRSFASFLKSWMALWYIKSSSVKDLETFLQMFSLSLEEAEWRLMYGTKDSITARIR